MSTPNSLPVFGWHLWRKAQANAQQIAAVKNIAAVQNASGGGTAGAGGGNNGMSIPLVAPHGLTGVIQQPQQGDQRVKPDQRFRSFAERYVVARAHLFRPDPDGHAEDQWVCLLDARRAYSLARRMSQHLDPEDL